VEQYNEGIFEDSRRVDIDGLEEARCAARRYHDRNVNERSFNVGDLVLRRIQNTEGLHKLSSPWEGPFTVTKVTGPGSYRLQTLEGEDVNNSWNIDQLCRFYAYSTDYPGGSSLHDTQRPFRRKRPPGPGTSLRTTLHQGPVLTATNRSWAAPSNKGLQQRYTERPCTPRSSLYGY
jgi:hypothetical protein